MSEKRKAKPAILISGDSQQPSQNWATLSRLASKPSPRVSPSEARKIMAKRVVKARPVYVPHEPKAGEVKSFAAQPGHASTVQSPASIAELARALKNDVDLLFYHVYNQVEYYPSFGLQKGSLGALIDGLGNPWDQCSLLVDLLREAGHTADFVFGELDLSNDEIANWLGTDSSNIFYASDILNSGGIPNEPYWTGTVWRITLSHIWVKVEIDSTDYVLDPSYKSYTNIAGIDLETAMDYDQGDLLTAADDGATHGTDDLWIQDVNQNNINSELVGYASNLVDWIKSNNPDATLDEVLGGRRINEIYSPIRQTSLPYQNGTPTDWTSIPNTYRGTMRIEYSAASIDETLYLDELYGRRLTVFFNGSNEPELRLDGTLLDTGTAQSTGSSNSALITVEHPYAVTWYDQSFWQRIDAPFFGGGANYYLIGTMFGATRKGIVDYHNQKMAEAEAAGATEFSEALLGEQLSVLWHTMAAELVGVGDLAGRMSNCTLINHHYVGMCGRQSTSSINTAFFDIQGARFLTPSLEGDNTKAAKCSGTMGMHGYGLELLAIEQVCGTTNAASATRVLEVANADSTKIYRATQANWSADVYPNLTGYTINPTQIYDWFLVWDMICFVPEEGGQDIGNGFTADGYVFWPPTGAPGGNIYSFKGGFGPYGQPKKPPQNPPEKDKEDPVGFLTGHFKHKQTDLIVGSGEFPYKLSFESRYDSGQRFRNDRPMGLGWAHNWLMTAKEASDPFKGLGLESPIDAAASIVDLYVCIDLIDTNYEVLNVVTASLTTSWWCDQMRKNVVIVESADALLSFTKLPDGSYNAPYRYGDAWTLEKGTTFSLTAPQQDVRSFDADGNLDTWEFPYGVTISLTYNSGKLATVNNGMGRSLNFTYTGDKLTSVDDDNSRTIEFSYTDDELTAITDPLDEDVTFEYDEPGRMVSYFLPENPTDPMIVNTYDSLDRIASQLDMNENELFWYFTGWRSELVDFDGKSVIDLYDEHGNNIKSIDQLGFETNRLVDGRGRLVGKVMPEGNSTSWTYDENNNVLTETQTAKPGSSLSPIVRTFTWDLTYNKVATEEDGNGNITSYSYDPSTGQLLAMERPEVGGQVPTVSYQYNGRGQVLSKIDETGIQTQYSYDGTTEDLLSIIVNTNWKATVSGAITVSDQLTITVHDSGLSGGQKSKTYTVVTADTLADIAEELAAAINADSEITNLGITAKAFGSEISLSTAPGNATSFTESTSGGATESIALEAGLELTTVYTYNAWGDTDSKEDPRGNTEGRTFDAKRRLTQIERASPFNYIANLTHDKNDNLITVERQTGDVMNPWQIIEATYNLANQVETITVAGSLYTTRLYNDFRQLWKTTDAENRTIELQYDERRLLATETDPSEVVVETRVYTDNGLLASVEDANGNVTQYQYDGFDRLDKTIFPDGTFERNNSYDANGNVLSKLTRAGESTAFEFDALNRPIEKSPAGMAVVSFEYDLAGRLAKASTPVVSGNPASGDWDFTFDTAGRLIKEEAPDGKNVGYELDENGNIVKITYPDSWYVQRFYDSLNRLTDIKLNGDTDAAAHFEYDDLSRRTLLEFDNGTQIDYGFELNDDMSALEMAFNGSSVDFGYGYNGANQLNSQSVSDTQHLWHPMCAGTVEYDANSLNQYVYASGSCGRLYNGHNANGCLIDDGVWRFSYDAENHLVSANDGNVSASYVYDPMHRQTQKNVDGTKTRFVYSGWQRLSDYNGNSDTLQNRYVYGVGLDEPLITVASGGAVTYMYPDRLGSIMALANESGAVTNSYKYSPFGESESMNGTTFGFTGQRFDAETGLYYYKNRYYSPKLGRFLQPDPIGFDGGDLNLYTYVKNDPLNLTDPEGRLAITASAVAAIVAILFLLVLIGVIIYYIWFRPNPSICPSDGDSGVPKKPYVPPTGPRPGAQQVVPSTGPRPGASSNFSNM